MRRTLRPLAILGVFLSVTLLLLWAVSPIRPAPWSLDPAPALEGYAAAQPGLGGVKRLVDGQVKGPEDVHWDAQGRIVTGLLDGRVVRLDPITGALETLGDTKGRPLGLLSAPDGGLYVADALRGLLHLHPDGSIEVLATEAGGRPFLFADDLDYDPQGRVLFTDASDRFGLTEYKLDVMEHRGHGRVLRWDPQTRQVDTLADDLCFANGLAWHAGRGSALVVETGKARLLELRPGEAPRVLLENLPAYPDNVSVDDQGRIWLALFGPRLTRLEPMMRWPSFTRVIGGLPASLMPKPARVGVVLRLDPQGRPEALWTDPGGAFAPITSVAFRDGELALGSLSETAIGHIRLP